MEAQAQVRPRAAAAAAAVLSATALGMVTSMTAPAALSAVIVVKDDLCPSAQGALPVAAAAAALGSGCQVVSLQHNSRVPQKLPSIQATVLPFCLLLSVCALQ